MCACVGVRERENPGAVPISLLFFIFVVLRSAASQKLGRGRGMAWGAHVKSSISLIRAIRMFDGDERKRVGRKSYRP